MFIYIYIYIYIYKIIYVTVVVRELLAHEQQGHDTLGERFEGKPISCVRIGIGQKFLKNYKR